MELIGASGIRKFDEIAKLGGTDRMVVYDTTDQLKRCCSHSFYDAKKNIVNTAIAATIELGESLFQNNLI